LPAAIALLRSRRAEPGEGRRSLPDVSPSPQLRDPKLFLFLKQIREPQRMQIVFERLEYPILKRSFPMGVPLRLQ
jgi:hypothetical protein